MPGLWLYDEDELKDLTRPASRRQTFQAADRVSPTIRKRARELAPFLEETWRQYHRPEWLGSDPLALAWEWRQSEDQELVAFLAAMLAYGQVAQAVQSVRRILTCLDGDPSGVVAAEDFEKLEQRLRGWRHRVTSGRAVALLLALVGEARRGVLTHSERTRPKPGTDCLLELSQWRQEFVAAANRSPEMAAILNSREFRHLLPDPSRGSACKRLLLFMRWMVRSPDGVDLGLWGLSGHSGGLAGVLRNLQPAHLIMPVDTHVLRIGRNLGLVAAGAPPTMKTALQMTAALRWVDPEDPTRFDFALCRLGILQACPTRENLAACATCALKPVCLLHKRMAARQ